MIVPVDVPLVTSGQPAQTDASGNFTSVSMIHPANWSVVRLVAQTTGNPTWTLFSDNNLPLDFSPGPLASMGLVLVAPGQRLTVQIQTALPSVSVSGHFVGVMSPSLEQVLPFYLPSPNQQAVSITAPLRVIGSLTGSNGAGVIRSLLVPPGTQAVGVMSFGPAADAPVNVSLIGLQTNNIYLQAGTILPSNGPVWVPVDPTDTQIQAAMTAAAANPSQLDVIASAFVQTVGVVQPVNVQGIQILTFPGGTGPNEAQLSVIVDPVGRNLLRTDYSRTYDLWLTAININNAVASVVFPAQGVGKRVQLGYCKAWMSEAVANQTDRLEIWGGPFGTGTQLWDEPLEPDTTSNVQHLELNNVKLVSGDNQQLGIRLTAANVNVFHGLQAGVFVLQR